MELNAKGFSTDINYIINVESRNLKYVVDEPLEKGGQNTAVTPMELIAGALSSCTIITLQMYFNHKGWEYKSIHVDVDFETSNSPITFHRLIEIIGKFEEKQLQRIEKIANACPVHKILEVGHEVITKVVLK